MARALRRIGWAAAGLLTVAAVAAATWVATSGRDFLWAQIMAADERALAGVEVPATVAPEAWRSDLDWLARELPRRHALLPSSALEPEAVAAEAARWRGRIGALSRDQAIFALMDVAAVAAPGDGHGGIAPVQRPIDPEMLPIVAYLFDGRPWITLAADADAEGTEILAVGDRPADELLAELAPHVPADNESHRRVYLAGSFSFAGPLRALGAAPAERGTPVLLTLRRPDEEPFVHAVEPFRLASLAGLAWGRRIQETTDSWSPADPRPRPVPYRLDLLEGSRTLRLTFSAVRDADDEPLAALAERLDRLARERRVERLVIDLRANEGGNNQLYEPLVATLEGHPVLDRPGALWVLVGRRTFSAAGNLAAALELRTRARFAGEPTGSRPSHCGDPVRVPLPASKILVRMPTRCWQDGGPWDRRQAIEPDLAVPITAADHFADRDPVLAAVLAHPPDPAPESSGPWDAASAAIPAGTYRLGPHLRATIAPPERGRPARITVDGVRRFAASDLRPLGADEEGDGGGHFATGWRGVVLMAPGTGGPALDWRGVRLPLEPAPPDDRLPIERIRDGEVADGIAALRAAAARAVPDNQTELELNRIGYELLAAERYPEAIDVFSLQAELYPAVANSFDSLADAHHLAGNREAAIAASRRALELDPGFVWSSRRLAELGVE